MSTSTGIEVKVIDWKNGKREIAVHLVNHDIMLTLDTSVARDFAFMLMECADFIQPPFGDPPQIQEPTPDDSVDDEDNSESEMLFGPYDEDEEDEDEDEELQEE